MSDQKQVDIKKWLIYGTALLGLIAVSLWSLKPKPITIERGEVTQGVFEQIIIEDGITQIKERYVVSSPVDGTLPRVSWNPGDKVTKGQKLVTIAWDRDRLVYAPAAGEILRILTKDEGFIRMGQPILEIGDPRTLEIVVDVLTTQAASIKLGDLVRITNWGHEKPLDGKVARIEPSAFTKVSALGVEEQRVNVIIEITSEPTIWEKLGDRFRVECHIITSQNPDAILVPTGAVFKDNGSWSAFRVTAGEAEKVKLRLNERGPIASWVAEGLTPGDQVILYPGDRIDDGVLVK